MICNKCGTGFHESCDKCGMAVFIGSSFGEHMMSHMSFFAEKGGGMFASSGDGKYNLWEAPSGQCPQCWHKENSEQTKKPEMTSWAKEAKEKIFKEFYGNPS